MTKWKPIEKSKNLEMKQKKIKVLLTGIIILAIVLLLGSCKQIEYIYVETPREPIYCIDNIQTPLDMAGCLQEYKIKY